MRIITIGREFGSGGRELGKRLADTLNVPCYDQEIIEEVARLHGLEPEQIEHISKADFRAVYPITIGRRFASPPLVTRLRVKILVSQLEFINKTRPAGRLCHCWPLRRPDPERNGYTEPVHLRRPEIQAAPVSGTRGKRRIAAGYAPADAAH